jgi:8-oxo-dGTP pyrophosphatase MutT (NUDIX family)
MHEFFIPTSEPEWLGFISAIIATDDWSKILLGKSAKYGTWKPITGKVEAADRPECSSKNAILQTQENCCIREINEETGWSDDVFQKLIMLDASLIYHKPPEPARVHAPQLFVGILKSIYPVPVPNAEFDRYEFWSLGDVVDGYRAADKRERMNPVYAANHCAVLAHIAEAIVYKRPEAKHFEATFPRAFRNQQFIDLLEQASLQHLKVYDAEMASRTRRKF